MIMTAGHRGVLRALGVGLLIAYLLFLLNLTWLQYPSQGSGYNAIPFRSMIADWREGGREWFVNFLGNIVAFLPIGLLPVAIWPQSARLRDSVLFCLTLSCLIEAVQYAIGRRFADVDDILLNTVGGSLGYLLLWQPFTFTRRVGLMKGAVEKSTSISDGPL